jgi:uncharacterized membrane protein YhaH (DUF805 family)
MKRINRLTFTMGFVVSIIAAIVASLILDGILALTDISEDAKSTAEGIFLLLCALYFFVVWLFLALKRARDIGKYVPLLTASFFVSFIGLILLSILPGQNGTNRYGIAPHKGVHL